MNECGEMSASRALDHRGPPVNFSNHRNCIWDSQRALRGTGGLDPAMRECVKLMELIPECPMLYVRWPTLRLRVLEEETQFRHALNNSDTCGKTVSSTRAPRSFRLKYGRCIGQSLLDDEIVFPNQLGGQ